jgi:hypothetical protein
MIAEIGPENETVVEIADGTGRGSVIGVVAEIVRTSEIRMEADGTGKQRRIVGSTLEP